jgi:O-antigen ligase
MREMAASGPSDMLRTARLEARQIEHRFLSGSRVLVPAALASVVAGWLVARGHAPLIIAFAALALAAPFLLARPENGLLAGTVLVLLVPSSAALGSPQAGVVRVAVLLSFVGFCVLVVRGEAPPARFAVPDLFVAGLVIAAWASWFVRPHGPHTAQATLAAVLPAGFYLAGRRFGGVAWTLIAAAVLLATTAASVTVLYEFFVAHRPLFTSQSSYYWNANGQALFRPGGVFGSPPAAAATLAMSTLIGASLLATTRGAARRCVWICLGVSLAALVVTFTRASLIAVAVGFVLYLVVLRPPGLARLVYAGIVLALLAGVFVLPRVTQTSWYQKGILRPGSLAVRESYWSAAWPVIVNSPQHFLVGHGINSLYRDPTAQDALLDPQPDITAVPTLATLSPHSQYVRTLVEEGLVGLILLVGWLGLSLLKTGRAAWSAVGPRRAALAACAAAIASFLIDAYVADTLRETTCFALVALVSGVGVTLAQNPDEGEGVESSA